MSDLPVSPLHETPVPRLDLNALRAALMAANGFDQRTLELNRQGILTPEQSSTLQQSQRGSLRTAIIVVIVGVVVIGVNIIFQTGLDAETLIGAAVFVALIAGYFAYRSRQASADVRNGAVERYEGAVQKRKRKLEEDTNAFFRYFYVVNQTELEVSEGAYEALIEPVRYRVYYAPASKQLFSIEPVA